MRSAAQNVRWGTAFPVLAFAIAMTVAVVGAFVTGSGEFGAVTHAVEDASADSSNFLGQFIDRFAIWYAFGAGMVAAVNPCGFAMLPAYLGLYLGEQDEPRDDGRLPAHIAVVVRAVVVGLTVSLGFVMLFGAVGLPISLGGQWIADSFAWVGLAVGVLLIGAGAYLLAGGKIYNNLAANLSSRLGNPNRRGVLNYFVFGVAYAVASLSCTLPIFLVVIGASLSSNSVWDSARGFILYGLGMGSVILSLTIGMALFKGIAGSLFRKALPYMGTVSAVLLLLTGTFLVYYQLTLNQLLERIRGT